MKSEVQIVHDGDEYFAYSDDVPGLFLTSRDVDSLLRDVQKAVMYLAQKNKRSYPGVRFIPIDLGTMA